MLKKNKEQFVITALELTKARLGISTTIRDALLQNAVESVVEELEVEKGVVIKYDSALHLDFVKDYATWRYQSIGSTETIFTNHTLPMPRHLQYRLHNLIIKEQAKSDANV